LLLELTSGAFSRIHGYIILEKQWSPEFKCKAEFTMGLNTDTTMFIGIGNWGHPFCFTMNHPFVCSSRTWTVNTKNHHHLGLHDSTYGEVLISQTKGTTNKIRAYLRKVSPDGTITDIANNEYTITEAVKTLINFPISLGA